MSEQSRRSVLVVEDDPAAMYIFGTILRHRGYEVAEARNGGQALLRLGERVPDLVVVDIGLPGMDGFDLTRRIRSAEATRDLPVVVCTVHVYERDEAAAREAGCTVFLRKPLEPSVLAATIEQLIGPALRASLD